MFFSYNFILIHPNNNSLQDFAANGFDNIEKLFDLHLIL